MRAAKSLGSPEEVETKPSRCFRPYFLARTRCSGVRPVVKPSKPASATALIFLSSDHCLAAEGGLTRDQRLAMWALLGMGSGRQNYEGRIKKGRNRKTVIRSAVAALEGEFGDAGFVEAAEAKLHHFPVP